MAVQLKFPAKFIQVYAMCVDAELPKKFTPDQWVKPNGLYKVKAFTDALNLSDATAIIITDGSGNEIHPSDSHWSFSSDRFAFFEVILN
jgi:hypothetical protein